MLDTIGTLLTRPKTDTEKLSEPNETTIEAIIEGRRIATDPTSQEYTNVEDLKKVLEV